MMKSDPLETFSAAKAMGIPIQQPVDALAHAHQLAERSRRRVTWLAVATAFSWILACSAAMWLAHFYFEEYRHGVPYNDYLYAKFREETHGVPWQDLSSEQQRKSDGLRRIASQVDDLMTIYCCAAVALCGLSALLSLWLIIASRRATLRQVNANLLLITEQLKSQMSPPESLPRAAD